MSTIRASLRAWRLLREHGFPVIAVLLASVAVAETVATEAHRPLGLHLLVATGFTLPVAFARRAPLTVTVLVFSAVLGIPLYEDNEEELAWLIAPLLVASYASGAHCQPRRALVAAGYMLGALALGILVQSDRAGAGDFIFLSVVLAVPWVMGRLLRDRVAQNVRLADRAELLETQREQLARIAVAEERARIARELHDVVAHSVSVIAVQTAAVRRRLTERPDDAVALQSVEATARQALAEMRRLLGVLRTDEDGLALAPQPGLAQLDALAAQLRESGLPVEVEVDGDAVPLAAGVDLTAYRIVQEALTNTLKHAGGARARVRVAYRRDELRLEIRDDGTACPAAAPGGHGLIGMRERVALYGGQLQTGPAEGAGFAVVATLPLSPA